MLLDLSLLPPGGTLPRCTLCCDFLSSTDMPVNIIVSDKSREVAPRWSQKYIPTDYFEHKFTLPTVHASCKPKFNTRLSRFDSVVKPIEIAADSLEVQDNDASTVKTRSKRPRIKTRLQLNDSVHNICFICYRNRTSDRNKYKGDLLDVRVVQMPLVKERKFICNMRSHYFLKLLGE